MDDLTTFIAARLDEDEVMAQEAASAYAFHRQDDHGGDVWTADEIMQQTIWSYQADEHMARHDPARVLREVAAKREILTQHEARTRGEGHDGKLRCRVCTAIADGRAKRFTVPCPTVLSLASAWSDHPDYAAAVAA